MQELDDLISVRDWLRLAVSRFREAGLAHGHGATTALDEAAFLVLETLHLPIDDINPWLDARLTGPERALLLERINARISTRKPLAYLLNKTYLNGLPFYVDERTIVPRSYLAELLAAQDAEEGVLGLIRETVAPARILDLCTGSGCLAIVAAHVFPEADIDAIDLSPGALEVAAINVEAFGLEDRVHLHEGDLLGAVPGVRYDLILSNPPYVSEEEMAVLPPEYGHEPRMALAGGGDGLDLVRRILKAAPAHLSENGALIVEIGTGREILEEDYPDIDFVWLDTEESSGEVFWVTRTMLLQAQS